MVPFRFTRRSLYVFFTLIFLGIQVDVSAQSGTEFWLAPPDITDLHNSPGGEPLYLLVSSTGQATTVTIDQPANGAFLPIVVNVAANKSVRVNLTPFKSQLETRPTNTVVNTGLHITATTTITCYYECANTNNTDIWALKGPNAEGTEFYIPLHKHAPFNNEASFGSPHQAFASFDICATQNNTVVTIYSPTPVDGHAALQQFTVNLNRGQSYSCGWTGANWSVPSTHPAGAIVLADKPITVSLKDDSDHNPSGGCYDILGDQIVPVDVVGEDYIAVKGSLNNTGDESVVLMATQNNTQVFVDGSATPLATLFAGEYYRIDMDSLSTSVNNALYVHCSKPTYAMHITGFGCEMGMAQLPPLNCAGSQQLNFLRDDAQTFYITVLCRATAVNGFTVTGSGTASIPPASFVTVPGTGGVWKAAKITYNTTQVPVDSTFKVANSIDVFALGVVNGGATSGCKYGYFSEFVAPIVANAGVNQTICANTTALLAGTVSGGTITGQWTSNGTGSFSPNSTTLNAVYTPSAADAATGSVILTLTSTGACNPVSDQMTLTITPAPTANAGMDQSKCSNNSNVSLTGAVTVATGGVWTGGLGSFLPANNVLGPVYVPTAAEISSGSITLTLTTTGNGICNPVSDNITIVFTPQPVVNAGADQTVCGNNPAATLSGSVTVASGGVWTGGGGSFVPSATSLNPVYTATPAEILSGSVTLTLTSTGNVNCNAVSDNVTISFSAPPTITAGADQVKCANNAATTMAGNVSGATGAAWSGGLGVFTPNNTSAVAVYTPTAGEIASGIVTLTFTSTGNGTCNAVTDQMAITFTAAPTANAGLNQVVCANNPVVLLSGSFTVSSGASWSGGTGIFNPGNTSMNATYTPSVAEIAAGTVTLTLTTTGNGTCNEVNDQMLITITPSPIVNAGPDQTKCSNNANINLAGSVTTATGGTWSGGAGTFNPSASALNASYTPTPVEIASGSITLTLTSTGNGGCNAVSDQVTIFFSSAPTASAGSDQVLCANNAVATLAGNITVAGGGQWTGGLGIFLPNNNTLNATYTPTNSEISSGSIQLTLTTTSNGTCNAVSDQVTLSFTSAPTVNAGSNITVCGNNEVATLSGSFTTAAGAIWSSGTGVFLPNTTSMTPTYTPSPAEIAAGSVTLTLTSTGNGTCATVSDQVLITITPKPVVNAGADQTKCANNSAASLSGSVTVASGGTWSGGAGTFNPSTTSLNAVYTPSAQEISNGSVILTLTSTGNGICNAESDQVTIFYSSEPTANAGSDQTLCANNALVNLAGNVTTAGGGQWTGGLGIFSPNNNTLNASYTPSAAEIAGGSLILTLTTTSNGGCNAVSDAVLISFTAAPVVSASSDVTVCANSALVNLNGSFSIASGAVWTGGTGIFTPNNSTANASYSPSVAETNAGSVVLTYTTTGNGNCNAENDNMIITITPSPVVNAGADQTKCANNADATLGGSITVATGGTWTGGAGSFNPSSSSLNAVYTPTAQEISNGSVTLTLTSTGNGLCNAVSDQMTIFYSSPPTVSAGPDQTLCGNNAVVNLIGSVTTAGGGQWSGGLGVFSPGNNSLNTTYTPSAAEIASGSLALTLTTTSNGGCNAVSDAIILFFTPAPVVNASTDETVCANNPLVNLNGSFSVATGAVWTGGSGVFSPNNATANATYLPAAADISAGTVVLTYTSTGNGTCNPVSDEMTITITPSPIVNAGTNISACANNAIVSLGGQITNASGGIWSGGTGSFAPNASSLNATYTPSNAEILAGNVTLTLTSTGNGNCLSVSDDITISFSQSPIASAGGDQVLCGNNAVATLNGNYNFSTGAQWTGGFGLFSPSATATGATYAPTAGEIATGFVNLVLTTTGNGNCIAVSDTIHLTYTPSPTVNAGADLSSCANNSIVTLNGSYTVASGALWSGGQGNFIPSNTSMNAIYTPTLAEINAGGLSLTLTTTGTGNCTPISDVVNIVIIASPSVNAGADQLTCISNLNVGLSGSVSGPTNTGVWTSTGSGIFMPNNTTLNATYQCSNADVISGSVNLTLTSSFNGSCNSVTDQMTITILPPGGAAAGIDQTVCGNNATFSLNGIVNGGASTGVWGSAGTGTFSNNQSLNTTYTPSAFDILNGSVVLHLTANSCNFASDSLLVTITEAPLVLVGNDLTICSSETTVALSGAVTGGSSTGIWTTTGTGSFSPSNASLNATYTPSAADILAQNISLVLTSSSNGQCLPAADTLLLNIFPSGNADAGADQTLCANNGDVDLTGVLSGGATLGQWTTNGSGVFVSGINALNNVYQPSIADLTNGNVILTLTATNSCNSAMDELNVTFTPAPSVDAGIVSDVCANNPSITLDGQFTVATGATWSGGSGSFNPNNTTVNATYSPSASEIQNGSVTLQLTSNGNGQCLPVSDEVTIMIVPAPIVNAGADQLTCITDLTIALNGNVQGVTNSGTWSTNGSGSFAPSNSALNAVYTLSSQDSINGGATLSLTSSNNLSCQPVTDAMTITIVPAGTADAGADVTVCANDSEVNLNGNVGGGATNGIWSTTGTGAFFPDNTSLNTIYVPSAFDIINGEAIVILTANTCTTTADSLLIEITPAPLVDAGSDQTICASVLDIQLNGSISGGATIGVWTTNGSGVFTPSASALNATYSPSAADVSNQNIQIILTSSNNGNCLPERDTMMLHIYPLGSALAGADQILCSNNANTILNGALGGGATTGEWSTTGSGFFIPNAFSLNATYVPSPGDLFSGGVILGLNATNSCNNAIDLLTVTFTPTPIADAGPAQSFCGSNPAFVLNGSVSNAAGGNWSGGNGAFTPSSAILNPTYTPSIAERNQGYVVLTLSTTGNGNCNAVSDTMTLYMSTGIIANAGPDQQVCVTAPYTQLQGIISNGSSTGTWSTLGSGTFSPGQNVLNALYTFSPVDIVSGDVALVLTSNPSGSCVATTDTMHVTFGQSAFAFAGYDQSICASENEISLNGFVSGGASQGTWSTTGNGGFIPENNTLITDYTITASDIAAGEISFILTSTDNGSCLAGIDTLVYSINPVSNVTVGGDLDICADNLTVDIGGSVSGASSSGIWSSLGSGSFNDNTQLNTTYTASASDVLNGTVTLILSPTGTNACAADSDSLTILIHEIPSVSAGSDISLCGSVGSISLSGSIGAGATGVVWSSNGSGSFSPDANSLNASYNISASDVLNGEVEIVITSTGQGACAAATDTTTLTLIPVSQVNAGNDFSLCEDNLEVLLNGSVTGASVTGQWTSSGTGIFVPDATTLTATYLPSAGDSINGNVMLILHAIGTGICSADADSLNITIQRSATVFAGSDQTICSSEIEIDLNGQIGGGATSGIWSSSGNGNFSPDNTTLDAVYSMSASDISNGQLTFILTADGEGVCGSISDTLHYLITAGANAVAGNDVTICSDNLSLPLAGNVSGAVADYVWSTTGSGLFTPDNTTLNATYLPGANDSLVGGVTLILTANASGTCLDVSDSLLVTITSPALVNAGSDQSMCATDALVNLNGSVSGGTSTGSWISSGSGTFTPDNSTLNAAYHPSSSDLQNGLITLTLSSTGNGICDVVTDNLQVSFIPAASVSAGSDRVLCGETNDIQLNGSVTGNTTSGVWSTNGSGEFVSGSNTLNTVYSLSNADIQNGEVMLVLSSTNNTLCPATTDTMNIIIEAMPVAAFSSESGDVLDVQFTDESIGAVGWIWDFGVGGSSTSQNPSVVYPSIGFYEVSLIIFSEGGCMDTTSAMIEAIEPIGTPVAIPSGFSPNGDQSNDVLHVLGGPFKEVDFRIYNEWGNLVYSTTDPLAGWDGSYKGELQPGGVYVYTASGITVKGRYVRLSGNVTLIR